MDKESFWSVIGEVNRCVQDGDQEAVLEAQYPPNASSTELSTIS